MRRLRPLFALALALAACTDSEGQAEEEPGASEGTAASYCVAYVELTAEGAVEADRLANGEPPEHADPTQAPAFKRFLRAAPEEVQDDVAVLVAPAGRAEGDLRAAAEALDERLAADCLIGREGRPMDAQCRARAVELEQDLTRDPDGSAEELARFASRCRPEDDPYRTLDDLCAGFVYAHYVDPAIDEISHAGGPTNDDHQEISARFLDDCGGHARS